MTGNFSQRARRGFLCASTKGAIVGVLTTIVLPSGPALAQNISYNGPGDYVLSGTTPIAGGPRTVDITTTSGNATIDLADVAVTNPLGAYAYPGTAIGVNNQGNGTISIASNSITTSGATQIYAIDAKSVSGAITIVSGSINALTGSLFASGRGISAVSASGSVTISSDIINTDNPTGIYAKGSSVSVASKAISIGGDGSYSFSPTAAIYAEDSGGGVTVTSTNISGSGTGILLNGSGTTKVNSDTITLSGLYARGIASYGSGDVTITSKNLSVSGYGGVGISADARLNGAVSIDSDTIMASDFASAIRVTGGSAPVAVASKAIVASGDFAAGINVSAGTGAIQIKSGSISTNGYSAAAITLTGFGGVGGAATIVSDNILTSGGQSNGISAEVSGPLTITSNSLTTMSGGSTGLYAASSSGALTITSGILNTMGAASPGIVATTGNGDLTIVAGTTSTSGGADLYSGSGAISASARGNVSITADRTITTGSNSGGISANGTSVTIKANNVSASGSNSGGIYANGGTISITAGTVTSTAAAITAIASGNATVNVGSVSSSNVAVNVGPPLLSGGGSAIYVRSGAAADVTVNQFVSSATAPAVTINAGTTASFTLGVAGQLGSGTQVLLSGRSGATFVNYGTISGDADSAVVSASAGPLTFTNNGVFTGLIGFTSGNDSVINAGTYRLLYTQDFGAGADIFTNNGVLAVLPGTVSAGTVALDGLEQFVNRGLVDLRNGHAGDTLSLSGAFSGGTGSALAIDVAPGTNGALAVDRLFVNGAVTGSTRIIVNQIGAVSLNAGTVIATGEAGSSSNAFVVDPAGADRGLIHYGVSFDASTHNYSLVVTPSDAVYRMLKVNEGAQQLWYRGADILSSHMQGLRNGGSSGARLWGQMVGEANSRDTSQSMTSFGMTRAVDLSYKQDNFGTQLGLDLVAPADGQGVTAGVMAGYLNSRLTFRGAASRSTYDSVGIATYAGLTRQHLFANLLAQYNHLWIAMRDSAAGYTDRLTGNSYGVQGEFGFRIEGSRFVAEPVVSLAYVHTSIGDVHALGQNVQLDNMEGLRSKVGVRLASYRQLGTGTMLNLYLQPNYVHEFKGNAGLLFGSNGIGLRYANQPLTDYAEGRIGVGIGSQLVNGFIEGFGNVGSHYRGGGGRVGLRLNW